jgi:diguanylate cyclase (GGDEF)-like protein/hemerythrin-like metal-binding protein/PAS domain S-box-containing protein
MKESVPTFKWNHGLATGLTRIDEQHRRLFDTINKLVSMHETDAGADKIQTVLDDLRRYAAVHFKEEENLMAAHSVSARIQQAQLRAHEEFIHYIDRTSALVAAHPDIVINLLLVFLLKWLARHEAGIDLAMAKEIAAALPEGALEETADPANAGNASVVEGMYDVYDDLGGRAFEILELSLRLEQEIVSRKLTEQELMVSEARFHALIDYAFHWEYWEGADGHIQFMSPSCERITGYSAAEFIANPELIYDIINPDDRHLMEAHRSSNTVCEEGEEEVEYRIVKKNGAPGWIAHSCNTIYTQTGEFLGRRGCNRDRTGRHKRDDYQRLAETVFKSVNDAVLVTDRSNRIVAANPSFTTVTGYTEEEMLGKDPSLLSDGKMEPEAAKGMWQQLHTTGRWQGEIMNRRKSGEFYVAWVSINSVLDAKGELSNYVAVFSDISERKINEKRMQYLAHYDLLTDLPNRALLADRLQQALIKARRDNELLALMFVDLDKFKSVNDTYGHYVGDLLLKEVAKRLKCCIRESDTAARIGGDEFIVLLPSIQVEKDARTVAEKILEEVTKPCDLAGNDMNIGVSIGIAIYPIDGKNSETLLTNADAAMYQAKHGGGPSIISFGEIG